ncbi:hypothetical protein BaRGS_00002619, partial [Batillaria attramentaria]
TRRRRTITAFTPNPCSSVCLICTVPLPSDLDNIYSNPPEQHLDHLVDGGTSQITTKNSSPLTQPHHPSVPCCVQRDANARRICPKLMKTGSINSSEGIRCSTSGTRPRPGGGDLTN